MIPISHKMDKRRSDLKISGRIMAMIKHKKIGITGDIPTSLLDFM